MVVGREPETPDDGQRRDLRESEYDRDQRQMF